MSRTGKARLGRGLGALLGEEALRPGRDDPEVRSLNRNSIVPNPFQPRRAFRDDELAELQQSIEENGLLQPLVVRPAPDARNRYQLVAGERRLRAISRLGWTQVPAVIRDVDDRSLLVLALVENIQRAELGPLEEAEGYRSLVDEFGLTQAEVAHAVGKSRSTVANMLRLLRLPLSVRRFLTDGQLSMGHARALLALEHPGRMTELARQAAQEGWTVREVEARVSRSPGRPTGKAGDQKRGQRRDPILSALEGALQETLGTRVALKAGREGNGEIRIPFRSADDFDRIFEIITGQDPTDLVG
jgi:ParB family transcriptional regulator, chromosome partitioning protein